MWQEQRKKQILLSTPKEFQKFQINEIQYSLRWYRPTTDPQTDPQTEYHF